MPKRIQRKRTKGWKMPVGSFYVGRPTKWGNPFRGEREDSVRAFELFLEIADKNQLGFLKGYLSPLRGHDLVCWCPLDKRCHADVLLRLANSGSEAFHNCR